MDPVTGMPAVPRGREAIRAWRRLDDSTRAGLLSGAQEADPALVVVAIGYARASLVRPMWQRICLGAGVVLLPLVAAQVAIAAGVHHISNAGADALLLLALVVAVAYAIPVLRRRSRLQRMEMVYTQQLNARIRRLPT